MWRVDGHWVRDHLDIEFTNGAHHLMAAYIPQDEIWVDREAADAGDEWRLWLDFQVTHRRRMAEGAAYLQALGSAERVERSARRAALGERVERRAARTREIAVRRLLGVIDRRRVYLVRGRAVRDRAYVHFTMGGHNRRYRFIPPGEVWIDDAVAPAERPAVLHHELVELRLMDEQGMKYPQAHALASAAELDFRHRGRRRAAR